MTLIPLISAIVAAPQAVTAPAGPPVRQQRHSYGSDTNHHPVAALLAVGLPVALVVAVALSPMIVKERPQSETPPWISFTVDQPKPEPRPDPQPRTDPIQTRLTVPPTPLPRVSDDSAKVTPLPPYVPPAGTGTGTTIVDPPAPPPRPLLVLAEVDPRFAATFQPDYPASEQRREVEGYAKVRVLIGIDGRVKAIEQISSDSPGFFEETRRRALAKWRFKPATRGGVPEESWKVMTVHFQIRNG